MASYTYCNDLEYCYETLLDMFDSTSEERYMIDFAVSTYGYNDATMNHILYYLFGMEMDCFIDSYENGEL